MVLVVTTKLREFENRLAINSRTFHDAAVLEDVPSDDSSTVWTL
ncbi:hypothetical protein [Halobacterium hubeiense]